MSHFEGFRDCSRNDLRDSPGEASTKNVHSSNVSKNSALLLENIKKICEEEELDILPRLTKKMEKFRKLLSLNAQEGEVFFWVMRVVNKASNSSLLQMKSEIVLSVWNNQTFTANFQSYLTSLPYMDELSKKNNPSFWNDIEEFWTTFVTFCMFIINFSPSVASVKCRCLLDVGKLCLNTLTSQCNIILQTDFNEALNNLTEDLDEAMRNAISKKDEEKSLYDFRDIPILPTKSEIVDEAQPFLRPIIVNGAYSSIDHYLDVQFRLLREDCFKGLRDDIRAFIGDNKRGKFEYIRVYKNVKFLGLQAVNEKLGYLVQWQDRTGKKRNYLNCKEFMFGSLLIFSRDNFKHIFLATVVNRDEKLLSEGQIMVSIQAGNESIDKSLNLPFVMIESQVYFEPYYHVLKALQSEDFSAENFPMKKYIVDAKPFVTHPTYLTDSTMYQVTDYQNANSDLQIPVLDISNWPQASSLNLNLSQYKAYQLALTREFAIIQRPPGTGKTYLGLMVARTLIENTTLIGPMLVICYTNHALDQFLEGLLNVTSKIVRIGGQSKNYKLNKFNLSNLRYKLHQTDYRKLAEITEYVKIIQMYIQRIDEDTQFDKIEYWLQCDILVIDKIIMDRGDFYDEPRIIAQNDQIKKLRSKICGRKRSKLLLIQELSDVLLGIKRMLQDLLDVMQLRVHRGPHVYGNEEKEECYRETKAVLWQELYNLESRYKEIQEECEKIRLIADQRLLEGSKVIGMTTTGVARLRELLLSLKSPIGTFLVLQPTADWPSLSHL